MNLPAIMESTGAALAVLTPLVVVPLTVFTFYLRSLREQQSAWHADFVKRIEAVEGILNQIRRHVFDFERDYTTKEEWLREEMQTRRRIEMLRESTWRLEAAHAPLAAPHHHHRETATDDGPGLMNEDTDYPNTHEDRT